MRKPERVVVELPGCAKCELRLSGDFVWSFFSFSAYVWAVFCLQKKLLAVVKLRVFVCLNTVYF